MDTVLKILNFLGYVSTVIVIFAVIVEICRWVKGISPALLRLGKGLASRKIAIFAENDAYSSLSSLLIDSKLFSESNITQITTRELRKAENFSLFLAHWKTISSCLGEILLIKKDDTALIIYAPQEEGFISKECIAEINKHRNIVLVNFRGRLLNDIVTSMITTSCQN
ncbi:MAG: hypothetical protein ABIA04_14565 [Pseudomonadota bacterium]